MAQIQSIGAGIYTQLHYTTSPASAINPNAGATANDESETRGYADAMLTQVTGVREFPSFGSPANIVNVPVYGQAQSSQIQGQADAPTFEFTLNYVPEDHNGLQALVNNGNTYVWRIRLANAVLPDTLTAMTEVSDFYVVASVAAFTITPNLTDSNQATLTLATQGDIVGPETTV